MVEIGRLEAQGAGKTETLLFRGYLALRRRGKLAEAEAAASGKQRERKKSQRRRLGLIARPGARGIDTQRAPRASAKPRRSQTRLEDRRKDAGGGAVVVLLFRIITALPLSSFCKLLSNFLKKMKISKNQKVAQLFKLYNFASRNIFKFCLHFKI